MGQYVEFRGVPAILQGYELHTERNDAPYWSIWAGKDFRFAYYEKDEAAGREYFDRILQMIQQNQAPAIYTIKFHDELNKKGKIDTNSPVVGSFTFRVADTWGDASTQYPTATQPAGPVSQINGIMGKLQDKIMDKMIAQLDAADDASMAGVEQTREQFILDIANSEMGTALIGMIRDYLPQPKHRRNNMGQQQQERAGMAGVGDDTIDSSIARLQACDKDFAEHLAMLAEVAEQSPFIYRKAIKKLQDLME